jgi:hypothetical protein
MPVSTKWSRPLRFSKQKTISVFRDVAPCSLVKIDRCFRGAYCLHHQDYGEGSNHLWNVGQFLRDYMTKHPGKQPSSYSPSWEPEISLSDQTFVCIYHALRWYRASNPAWSSHPNHRQLDVECKLSSLLLCSFLHPPVTLPLSDPYILPSTLFSNTLKLCPSELKTKFHTHKQ